MRTNKEELQARKTLRYNAYDLKSLSSGQKNKLRRHGLIDFCDVAGVTYCFVTDYGKEFLSPKKKEMRNLLSIAAIFMFIFATATPLKGQKVQYIVDETEFVAYINDGENIMMSRFKTIVEELPDFLGENHQIRTVHNGYVLFIQTPKMQSKYKSKDDIIGYLTVMTHSDKIAIPIMAGGIIGIDSEDAKLLKSDCRIYIGTQEVSSYLYWFIKDALKKLPIKI